MDHKYRLVVFVNKKKKKEIDIVPRNWFNYDEPTDTLTCKFMPEPYTQKTRAILLRMLKNCEEPSPEWPSYPVDLRGRACTYEEAEAKVLTLESKPYAYTTENEKNSQKKATEDRKKLTFKSVSSKGLSTPTKLNSVCIDLNANLKSSDVLEKKMSKSKAGDITGQLRKRQNSSDSGSFEDVTDSSSDEPENMGRSRIQRSQPTSKNSNFKTVAVKDKLVTPVIEKSPKKVLCGPTAAKQQDVPDACVNRGFEDRLFNFVDERYRSSNYKIGELQSKLISIEATLIEIRDKITNQLTNSCSIDEAQNLEGDDWSLPCQSHEQFVKFDDKISTDNEFKKKLIRQIILLINKKSPLRRNLGRILRVYMSRNLALMFTTARAVPGKHIFAETKLYACMKVAASQVFKEENGNELSFQTFKEAMQAIFNNAKDWDGQGRMRKKVEPR